MGIATLLSVRAGKVREPEPSGLAGRVLSRRFLGRVDRKRRTSRFYSRSWSARHPREPGRAAVSSRAEPSKQAARSLAAAPQDRMLPLETRSHAGGPPDAPWYPLPS